MRLIALFSLLAIAILASCNQSPTTTSSSGDDHKSSEHVVNLDDATFAGKANSGLVLIDFWAPWCGPCRMQGPIVDEVAETANSYATIAKVDVDKAPKVAEQFGIRSIPTIVIMKDGEVLNQYVGVTDKATLLASLDKAK